MVDVTVIIPVFNRCRTVLDALNGVVAQTMLPASVIVVDDGSTDHSADAVQAWANEHAGVLRCVIQRRAKSTAALARQAAFESVPMTSLVAFLDSDDYWPNDFLQRASHALSADGSLVAASADRRFVSEDGEQFSYDNCRSLANDPIPWIFRHGGGIASCTVLRSHAVQAVGGWNARCDDAEDSSLFTDIATQGNWCHLPGKPVTFRWGLAASRGEADNLSQIYPDRFQRWAISHATIYHSLKDRYPERRRRRLRRHIASFWFRAGQQCEAARQFEDAIRCYDNTLTWNPSDWRAKWRRRKQLSVVGRLRKPSTKEK